MRYARQVRSGLVVAFAIAGSPAGILAISPPVTAAPVEAARTPSPLGDLPTGWSVALTDVIAVFSPPSPDGSVTIVAPPVMTVEGDVRTAIVERAPALIEELFGEPRPAGEPIPLPASDAVAPGLMVPMIVALDDGSEARIEVTGYPLPGKRLQVFLLALPSAMGDGAVSASTARTLIDQWRASGLAVSERLTSEAVPASEIPVTEDGPDAAPVAPSATAPQSRPANPDDEVENVIYFLRYAFDGANPAAVAEPVAATALLFKDGRVFEGEPRAPADFDPASRPPGSTGTGRWQRDGEAYALAFSDGTQGTAVAAAAKTLAAPAALSFAGTYRAIGGPRSPLLPDEIDFFPDGSLLLKAPGTVRSGTYAIAERTIRLQGDGEGPANLLFGFRGELDAPGLLILGNRIYERAD